ncbi:PARP9, partial [Cervus elaphus hippelaphus]
MERPGGPSGDGDCPPAPALSSPALCRNCTRKVFELGSLRSRARTVHSPPPDSRLWKYFSSFHWRRVPGWNTRTSSGDGGQRLEAMAVRSGMAPRVATTQLGRARAGVPPPRRPGAQSFSFFFPEILLGSWQSRTPSSLRRPPGRRLPEGDCHIWETQNRANIERPQRPGRWTFPRVLEQQLTVRNQVGLPHCHSCLRKSLLRSFLSGERGIQKETVFPTSAQNKFGCNFTLVSPAREGNNESLRVFRKMLTPRVELSVWKDDLTRHAVDAVVNAANEELLHGGGLAQALVKAGGFEIQEESRSFVSKYGRIPTGEIVTTGAGKLPCRYIIHAVGPRWALMDGQECIDKLQRAIINILNCVSSKNSMNIKTVAIPALSSGIFQFPLDLCTETIVQTIKFYFQSMPITSNLKEIHLVSNEDPTVAAFKLASEIILGRNELESWVSQGATQPFNTMVVNNMTLQIVQGLIERQETDVIVNSVYSCNSLSAGAVSKSILKAAGDEIEQELYPNITKTPLDSPVVLVTRGFKLSCKYIYHVLWTSGYSEQKLTLKAAMKKCLENCLELNITSISFPAFGTGIIGMKKSETAEIMFNEVLIFARQNFQQLAVKFVILPEELETYKAFSAEMEKNKFKLQGPNNYPANRQSFQRQLKDYISRQPLQQGCGEARAGARPGPRAQAHCERRLSWVSLCWVRGGGGDERGLVSTAKGRADSFEKTHGKRASEAEAHPRSGTGIGCLEPGECGAVAAPDPSPSRRQIRQSSAGPGRGPAARAGRRLCSSSGSWAWALAARPCVTGPVVLTAARRAEGT